MFTTKEKGDITTVAIVLALLKQKIPVSVPWGDNLRYDLVIELENKLFKVQCKTARRYGNSIRFNMSSSYSQGSRIKENRSYIGDVDYFAIYYALEDETYLIPINDIQHIKYHATLNISKTKNNQYKNIRNSEKYKIKNIIYNYNIQPKPLIL